MSEASDKTSSKSRASNVNDIDESERVIEGPPLPSRSERTRGRSRSRSPRYYSPPSRRHRSRSSYTDRYRDYKRRKNYSPRRSHRQYPPSPDRRSHRRYSPERRRYSPERRRSRRSPGCYSPRRHSPDRRRSRRSPSLPISGSKSPVRDPENSWKARMEEREEKDKQYTIVTAERVLRTVFVTGLPLKTTISSLADWFEGFDLLVRDVQLQYDRHRKFKCCGFVEFYQKSSIPIAIDLTGKEYHGKTITICPTEAERNNMNTGLIDYNASQNKIDDNEIPNGPPDNKPNAYRLYVGNLDYGINEEILQEIFGQFGPLDMCKLPVEATGKTKGHAFIQYLDKTAALLAFYHIHAKELGGRVLRVDFTKDSRIRDPSLPPSPTPALVQIPPSTLPPFNPVIPFRPSSLSSQENFNDFDDDIKVSGNDRYLLTQMLVGAAKDEKERSTPAPIQVLPKVTPFPQKITTCVIFRNMFDPENELPGFEKGIEDDVRLVAESIEHIQVDRTPPGGVYIKFSDVEKAEAAGRLAHGRPFDGRTVHVEYIEPEEYDLKFNF